jgi:hypothetical protein
MQDVHWYNFQINILVHITYKVNHEFNTSHPQGFKILKEIHYHINDDKNHNSLFVWHVFTLH